MDLARQCVMLCLPIHAVTRAGTLSAALLRIVASRLPVKGAGRVTALSPRCRRAWRSVPLVLDDTHLVIAGVYEIVPAVDHLLTEEASPSFKIPSVKILALRVDLHVSTEVRMLSRFLRCFPNVETLHVEFSMTDRSTGKHYDEFLSKQPPIECLQSHTKKVILHEFQGDLSQVVFLQHLMQRVHQLHKSTIVLSKDILFSVDDMKVVLRELVRPPWDSKSCTVPLVGPKHATSTGHLIFQLMTLLIGNMDRSSFASLKRVFRRFGNTKVWMNVS